MADGNLPALGSVLQHPAAITTTPPAPLRSDSLDPPGSAKMVSLADLHVNASTPATPQELEGQVRCVILGSCMLAYPPFCEIVRLMVSTICTLVFSGCGPP